MVENYCKGGSEYSGILNFQNFHCRTNGLYVLRHFFFIEKKKNGHFEPKSDENSERQSDDNDIKTKPLILAITHNKTLSGRN